MTCPEDSRRWALLLRGLEVCFSSSSGLLGAGMGGPWGAAGVVGVEARGAGAEAGGAGVEAGGAGVEAGSVGGMTPRDIQGLGCGAQKNPWGLGPQKMCGENPGGIGGLSMRKASWRPGGTTLPQSGMELDWVPREPRVSAVGGDGCGQMGEGT